MMSVKWGKVEECMRKSLLGMYKENAGFQFVHTNTFLIMWRWRYSDWAGWAATWTTMVVFKCSQHLHHQLCQFFINDRRHRSQSLPVRLLEKRIRRRVYSASHCHRCGFDVGGRRCSRLTEPPRLVVAQVWRQDPEVSLGPHYRLPLHHLLCRDRHAAAVRHHQHVLLAHLHSYSTCQAAHSPHTASGKIRPLANLTHTVLTQRL